ncbi:MAG: hypothetical protein ACJAVT_002806 [Yoonia sp.]|jgi:hypothetical protein
MFETGSFESYALCPTAPRHVVFFSAKDKADILRIFAGLELLVGIPHATLFEVHQNTQNDVLSSEVDVTVYAEFDSAEAPAAFKAHLLYEASIKAVRPLRDMQIAAAF